MLALADENAKLCLALDRGLEPRVCGRCRRVTLQSVFTSPKLTIYTCRVYQSGGFWMKGCSYSAKIFALRG